MAGKNWIEIKASFDQPPVDWSPYADAFDRFGCPGSIQSDDPATISAYLIDVPGASDRTRELGAELLDLGVISVETRLVPDEDWSALWKEHFKPRRVGKRFVVRPTWEEFKARPDDLVIVLDPGQAFGTGDHPTTRLSLQLMEGADLANKSVADIGCGSGILSIGASLLGATSVVGSDLDGLAIEVAKANSELNQVDVELVEAAGFDALSEPQHVVISNIISATLIRLSPEAARWVKPGGLWIVSGIIEANWADVRGAAERAGFALRQELREDGWVGAALVNATSP